jgi:hypothetical protein
MLSITLELTPKKQFSPMVVFPDITTPEEINTLDSILEW